MNGMSSTEHKRSKSVKKRILSSAEVCSIIEACAKNSVTELKFGELNLKLGLTYTVQPQTLPGEAPSEDQLKTEEKRYILEREFENKDDEMEHMLTEDPSKFEDLLVQGEFDGDGSAQSGPGDETQET